MNSLHKMMARLRRGEAESKEGGSLKVTQIDPVSFVHSIADALNARAYDEVLEEWRRRAAEIPTRGVPLESVAKIALMCWTEYAKTKHGSVLELFWEVVRHMSESELAVKRCADLLVRIALHFNAMDLLNQVCGQFSLKLRPNSHLYGYHFIHGGRQLRSRFPAFCRLVEQGKCFEIWTNPRWHEPHFICRNLHYDARDRQFFLEGVHRADISLLGVLIYAAQNSLISALNPRTHCIQLDQDAAQFAVEHASNETLSSLLKNKSIGLGSVQLEKLYARSSKRTIQFLNTCARFERLSEISPTLGNVRVVVACGLDLNELSASRPIPLDRRMVELLHEAKYSVPIDRYVALNDWSLIPCLGYVLRSSDATEVLQHCMSYGRKDMARAVLEAGFEFSRPELARHPAYGAFSPLLSGRFHAICTDLDLLYLSPDELIEFGAVRSAWKHLVIREFRRRRSLEPVPLHAPPNCILCGRPCASAEEALMHKCSANVLHQVHDTCIRLAEFSSPACRSCGGHYLPPTENL